ncbi:MAG: YbjQ family protein [Candidatus Marinimicrobia bacterium]|nr:YbjQ family protein [Candidatus Neomarinimicrobiota bacterium]
MVTWVTTLTISGKEIEQELGVVRGNTVRARNVGRDIMAFFRTLVGGELPEYSALMAEAREQAVDRMLQRAEELGADAVVNVRFSTSMIMQSTAEILAYGTAVKLKK